MTKSKAPKKTFEDLLILLKAHGVTYYKRGELELTLEAVSPVISIRETNQKEIKPTKTKEQLDEETIYYSAGR